MNPFNFSFNCPSPSLPPNAPLALPPGCSWRYVSSEPIRPTMSYADDTLAENAYHFDAVSDRWMLVQYRGMRLKRQTPLIPGITITDERFYYANGEDELRNVAVDYVDRRGNHTVVIPAGAYNSQMVWAYFPDFIPYPGCTRAQVNSLLVFLLKSFASPIKIWFFLHQGFNVTLDNKLTFAVLPQNDLFAKKIFPRSVRMRRPPQKNRPLCEVLADWAEIFTKHPVLKLIGLLKIGSIFLAFAPKHIQDSQMLWLIQPSAGASEQQLNALLNANDFANYPPPCLESKSDVLLGYVSDVWDGIAVVVDRTFADEEHKRLDGLKLLTKAVRRDLNDVESGRNIVAVISPNGAYTAKRLDSDRVITLSTEGVQLTVDNEQITRVNSELEGELIASISSAGPQFQAEALCLIEKIYAERVKVQNSEFAATNTILDLALMVLRKVCSFDISGDGFAIFLDELEQQTADVVTTDRAIQQDFAAVLSSKFRSGEFSAVCRRNNLQIDIDQPTAIVSGNRLYLSAEMLEGVLAGMSATHNKKSLIASLAAEGVLDRKDGDTHPIDAHTLSGRHIRLYWYDICSDILDADILDYLANMEQKQFWLSHSEIPAFGFLPLLSNTNGLVAGRKIEYELCENNNCHITGQSGFGKSFLMCQLLAKNAVLGHRVVVLDTSRSFTYESLCQNLPQSFVDQNICFHAIETNGIPVNLFEFHRQAQLPTQKRELLDVLKAGVGELSAPQTNALRTGISKILSELKFGELFDLAQLLALFREGDTKNVSLLNRLEPLFDDIVGYGMKRGNWFDFLENSKPILVITLNSASCDQANQLVDMLLHTLFVYQVEHTTTPIDLFMDEIQNQNFGEGSPIRKIMKEGRKLHLSFYGATQDFHARSTDLGKTMGKAATQIFLRPTQNSEPLVAQELRFGKKDLALFDMLERGDAIIKGQLYSKEAERNLPATTIGRVQPFEDTIFGV
ncbi:MAG: hypothetical protein IK130_01645 [Oscillospiraceae bacterium]|nr:hypothetical protein [Oscillospiraceae bacterium]